MKRILVTVFIAAIIVSGCGNPTVPSETPSATRVGTKPPNPTKAVEAVSRIPIKAEALKGIEINVWYPWFGAQANLFEAMVNDFNQQNQWGIAVASAYTDKSLPGRRFD